MKTAALVPYSRTANFSRLFCDYIDAKQVVRPFYSHYPDLNGYKAAIEGFSFPAERRKSLVDVLQRQYSDAGLTPPVDLSVLASADTFTICTGHQLCLMTGPLYFVLKVISAIKLAEELTAAIPEKKFIPVFWMAGEDHDLAEVNHFHVFGKKIVWETDQTGAVGRMKAAGLDQVMNELRNVLGSAMQASELMKLISESYVSEYTVAQSTRRLLHHLFADKSLLILDPDEAVFKHTFSQVMKADLLSNSTYKDVLNTVERLSAAGYKTQVNPREVNLFLLDEGNRVRIDREQVSGRETEWEKKLNDRPESFSPNVLLRPLYQQFILPNLAYIGGPAETDYWLELKQAFETAGVNYPILHPRCSAVLLEQSAIKKVKALHLEPEEIFLDADGMIKKYLSSIAGDKISLLDEINALERIFNQVKDKVGKVDSTLVASADAELKKVMNALEGLEKKLLKSFKRKNENAVLQASALQDQIFPGGVLQERRENFMTWYANEGKSFIDFVYETYSPFKHGIYVISPQ